MKINTINTVIEILYDLQNTHKILPLAAHMLNAHFSTGRMQIQTW